MKFDFLIGNPPYQDETIGQNETYAPPIYHKFMDAGFNLSDKVMMIHPARFLFNAGSTPKKWNKERLSDEHFKVVQYYKDSKQVFNGVGITGGVAVTYRDKNKNFGTIEIFIEENDLRNIKTKVLEKTIESFSSIMYSAYSYHFTQTLHDENPSAITKLSKGHAFDLKSNVFNTIPFCFYTEKPECDFFSVLGRDGSERSYRYIKKEYIKPIENTGFYKIAIPKAWDGILKPTIENPNVVFTETFVTVGKFTTREEAENCLKYIQTKFARVLLFIKKTTQDFTPDKWEYAPIQDFSNKSDIDWTKSIREIDQQLYAKYDLSEDEIKFIEEKVKEMN